jgi:hypothetical protein
MKCARVVATSVPADRLRALLFDTGEYPRIVAAGYRFERLGLRF